jgi:hypothetical protein
MAFLAPFIVGAVVGIAGTWTYQRRKSDGENAENVVSPQPASAVVVDATDGPDTASEDAAAA